MAQFGASPEWLGLVKEDIIDPDPRINIPINYDYKRTLIEDGEVVQVDRTCVRPNSVFIQ